MYSKGLTMEFNDARIPALASAARRVLADRARRADPLSARLADPAAVQVARHRCERRLRTAEIDHLAAGKGAAREARGIGRSECVRRGSYAAFDAESIKQNRYKQISPADYLAH